MDRLPDDVHFLAWNGLSLTRPAGWELAALGRERLQLADGLKTVLDVRWNRIRGRFSFDAHLRRLAKAHGRASDGIKPLDGPPGWSPAEGLEARAFAWGGPDAGGLGALLFHAASSTAILAQCGGPAEQTARVLGSLRCHLAEAFVPWAVYDLRALTPGDHGLEEYSLQPGRYRLILRHKEQRLILHRLAPADVLLAGHDLVHWSRAHFKALVSRHGLMVEETGEPESVTWRSPLPPGRLTRTAALALRRPAYAYLRVWKPEGRNRLLCVEARGMRPLDEAMIKKVVEAYGTV